jgi:regulator of CtrA degradation
MAAAAFFTGTYDEALSLCQRARDYLAERGERECGELDLAARLAFALESMRLTARLTRLMAWLLAQRAVHGGELTRAEALDDDLRLGGVAVCLERGPQIDRLPAALRVLLEDSDRLYRRVARLDELARRDMPARWPVRPH